MYVQSRLRRTRWQNCPSPIDAVSPSPLTPSTINSRFASLAPVASEGMRPCTPLKPCARSTKYAGVLDEQPMPLIFASLYGSTPYSYSALMRLLVIELCPHPAHSVEAEPL